MCENRIKPPNTQVERKVTHDFSFFKFGKMPTSLQQTEIAPITRQQTHTTVCEQGIECILRLVVQTFEAECLNEEVIVTSTANCKRSSTHCNKLSKGENTPQGCKDFDLSSFLM